MALILTRANTSTAVNNAFFDPLYSLMNGNYDEIEDFAYRVENGLINMGFSYLGLTDTDDSILYNNSFPFTQEDVNGDVKLYLKEFSSDGTIDVVPDNAHRVFFNVNKTNLMASMDSLLNQKITASIGTLNSHMNANNYNIANVGVITDATLANFNSFHSTDVTLDDFLVNKRYTDLHYYDKRLPIILNEYDGDQAFILNITNYVNNHALVSNHGYETSLNGTKVRFAADSDVPGNLTNGGIYYIRIIDKDHIALYNTKDKAMTQSTTIAETTRIPLSGNAFGSNHRIIFHGWDKDVYGNYMEFQAVPRKDIVLRTGDKMAGDLILDDHPSPLNGEDQTDDSLRAASVYFVNKMVANSEMNSRVLGTTTNDLEKNDIIIATGFYRLVVGSLTESEWNTGTSFEDESDPSKSGILRDIVRIGNGEKHILTFSSPSQPFSEGDVISNSVGTATVISSSDEYAQARLNAQSHIEIESQRTDFSEKTGNGPIVTTSFNIKDGVITPQMLEDNFVIPVEMLDIDESESYITADIGDTSKLGISSFFDENFEVVNGFVSLKDQGVKLENIQNIDPNTAIGSLDNGVVTNIQFSDIVEKGGGLQIDNIENTIIDIFDPLIFELVNDEITLIDHSITMNKLQNVSTGTLLGRKTNGQGSIEVIPFDDLDLGGISQEDLGDAFEISNDKMIIKDNGISINKLEQIPSMTVLGNINSVPANVEAISLSITSDNDSVVLRKSDGSVSCGHLEINEAKVLETTVDSLIARSPTGQIIFTSLCGNSCNFDMTDTDFNGSVSATSFTETSDKRKKKDIQTITNALSKIEQLRGVTFKWKDDDKPAIGLIAQEVERILPDLVEENHNGVKSVHYSNMVALLVEGIKDLNKSLSYSIEQLYESGTVVIAGDTYELSLTNIKNDKKVLGVISRCYMAKDGVKAELYDRGKAKCKVLGTVEKGDLLVPSAIPGYAIVDNSAHFSKCIGKSMVDKKTDKKDIIDIFIF